MSGDVTFGKNVSLKVCASFGTDRYLVKNKTKIEILGCYSITAKGLRLSVNDLFTLSVWVISCVCRTSIYLIALCEALRRNAKYLTDGFATCQTKSQTLSVNTPFPSIHQFKCWCVNLIIFLTLVLNGQSQLCVCYYSSRVRLLSLQTMAIE